jgi:RNA polymerase sigma-70 factor, ECF subfamily
MSMTSAAGAYPAPVAGRRTGLTAKAAHDDNLAKDGGAGTSALAPWGGPAAHLKRWAARHGGAPVPDKSAGAVADLVRREVKEPPRPGRERLSLRARRGHRPDDGGSEALITALYFEHGRSLLAYATRLTNDRGEAEDVVQETLLRAWKHPEVLVNGQGSVRGWLLTVARNIVVDRARARSARPAEVPEQPARPIVAPDRPEDVVDNMAVLGAIDQLSPEHRSTLVELYWRGSTVAEAAQRLSVPPGTVKSRAYYGLQSLRGIMAVGAPGEKESA